MSHRIMRSKEKSGFGLTQSDMVTTNRPIAAMSQEKIDKLRDYDM